MALVSTLAVLLLVLTGLTRRADNVFYDLMSQGGAHAPRDDIVIVAIDNRSVRELGRWPWARSRHVEGLNRLAAAKPKAVAYDVLFVDPDPAPGADQALATAVKGAGRVLLPLTFDIPGENGAPFRILPPVEPIRSAAAGLGQVNLEFDPDGVVRRAMLGEDDGTTVWPQLTEAAYRLVTGHDSGIWSKGAARTPDKTRGLWRSRPLLIPYAGPPGTYRTIAFSDLVRGETPPEFLKDKIVLVGATADGLGDRYSTLLSGGQEVMPGVEVQANVLDALLSGRAIRPLGPAATAALSLIPLWLLLLGFLVLRPRDNMILGVGLVMLVLAASAAALAFGRVWVPPATAVLGLVVVYPLWSWRRLEATSAYMLEELKRFAEEPELLPAAGGGALRGDVVAREVEAMHGAIGRMRELRRFVDDTLQGLPDATLVVDPQGRVVMANRVARSLFDAPEGQRLDDLLTIFTQGDGPDEVSFKSAAYQLRREALSSTRGEPVGEIVRFTDVTALRTAARQRQQVLELLSHDMRSPQASILTLLDSLSEDRPPPDMAKRIAMYARRTLALADDFVHLARAESVTLDPDLFNLPDLMVEAADVVWPQAAAKSIKLHAESGEDEVLVVADRTLMARALINLIGNAVKYTEPGGRVDCRAWHEGEEAVCSVADTGRGMSPEKLSRLFERFHRGSAGKSSDGVGLGLAFVQTVIERHGATLECRSAEGEGTIFTLRMRLASPDDEPHIS